MTSELSLAELAELQSKLNALLTDPLALAHALVRTLENERMGITPDISLADLIDHHLAEAGTGGTR